MVEPVNQTNQKQPNLSATKKKKQSKKNEDKLEAYLEKRAVKEEMSA